MNDSNLNTSIDSRTIRNRVKFVILLTLDIPTIILYLLIFSYFITHRVLLRTHQHRALCILLSLTFFTASCELPMVIHFYYLGRIGFTTSAYCTWWIFLGSVLNVSSEFLMTIISIQRHMLVFNSHVLRIRKIRIFLHDLPLLLSIICPTFYYIGIILIYPCTGLQWDFSSLYCGWAKGGKARLQECATSLYFTHTSVVLHYTSLVLHWYFTDTSLVLHCTSLVLHLYFNSFFTK